MGRKAPSVQSDSDRLEPKLVRAVEADSVPEVKEVIHQAQGRNQCTDVFLGVGLIKACDKNLPAVARFLLENGANPDYASANKPASLLRAADFGRKDIAEALIDHGANLEAGDKKGRTALMTAAYRGQLDMVKLLIARGAQIETRDHRHRNVLHNLAADKGLVRKVMQNPPTIHDLLYAKNPGRGMEHLWTTMPKKMKATSLRWIHLPVNNVAWCDALLKKRFIEEEVADVDGYKALETSFNHQHRGHHHHSRFMRPMCQVVRRTAGDDDQGLLASAGPPSQSKRNSRSALTAVQEVVSPGAVETAPTKQDGDQPIMPHLQRQDSPPAISGAESGNGQRLSTNVQRPQSPRTYSTSTAATIPPAGTGKQRGKPAKPQTKRQETTSTVSASDSGGNVQANGQSTTPASKPKTAKRPTPGRVSRSSTNATTDRVANSCNLFMFMPYLHFETHARRKEMQRALEHPDHLRGLSINAEADEVLIRAHLSKSSSFLHVRRTLDQFFYHNIDTRYRDEDQVVFRFQRDLRNAPDPDPKIFMVDQLWMWIVGRDLIVTSFPQRWKQPRNDPLDVFEGIVEDINSIKMRDPVQNVYELAMTIAGRCFGTFDRHRKNDDGFQFLDMFGASLGVAMDREAKRFQEFSRASEQASIWLRSHQKSNKILRNLKVESKVHHHASKKTDNTSHEDHPDTEFIDKLLDVGPETDLLAEIKDIRDELDILKMVLNHQSNLLPDLRNAITTLYQDDRSLGALRKVTRTFEEQEKTITNPLKDIERMEDQAKRIYESIRDLLDLKQKHANAFEARFAREQALGAQRQGQTIMVFTIVTVIFLPLSFIAAFFAINVESFPHNAASGQPEMSFGYVSQYIFGIGLAISIPCIAIALSVDELSYTMKRAKLRVRQWAGALRGRRGGREKMDLEYERQTLKIEHTLSVARSLRRSGDITWKDDGEIEGLRRSGVYHRRRPSLWDEEAAKRM
ncbi:hypothetical protein DOTSEDRAFT_162092 [Dothistroma septosporum NZE10]|uniref:Uncharacterized protein n=1 Tax=Dothistroma septosporum (strain NZE10 / CBS 128990) TaxID=675120 RepID=N1Q216_DOTSN|nr:hypothetical protein DOTSEDRAFT_162092 [Dothistroma septosporum NZE10]